MKYFIIIFLALSIGTSNLYAQTPSSEVTIKAFIKASKIKNDSARLSRFDELARRASLLTENTTDNNNDVGDWEFQTKKNPLDDTETVYAALQAEQGTNGYNQKPIFVARCKSNNITVFINWGEYLGDNARVTYRIGKNDSHTRNWSVSTDSKASFFPRHTERFLKSLENSTRFVAQVTPYDSNPITAVFNITGANKVIPKILSCSR